MAAGNPNIRRSGCVAEPVSACALLAATLAVTPTSQDSGETPYAATRANDLARLNGILTAEANVDLKDER